MVLDANHRCSVSGSVGSESRQNPPVTPLDATRTGASGHITLQSDVAPLSHLPPSTPRTAATGTLVATAHISSLDSVQSDQGPMHTLDNLPSASADRSPTNSSSAPDVSPAPTTPHRRGMAITPSTPYSVSSHDSEGAYSIVPEIRAAVNAELAGAWVAEAVQQRPFQEHLTKIIEAEHDNLDSRVEGWLKGYDGYNSETELWSTIKKGHKEKKLYDPIVKVLNDVLDHFGQLEEKEGQVVTKRREVVNTHGSCMPHNEADGREERLQTEPDITILGTGPSATNAPDISEFPSYSEVASLWEIKTKPDFTDAERGQVACYAREVLIQQPNRRFVYVTLMTGAIIRILRFDRAGCYYSQPIDFHKNAKFFVKLVVLLGSLNEDLLGFDTSITWLDGQRVLKMTPVELFNPTTGAWEPNTEELVFRLAPQPVFARRTIRSRGTVCWDAEYQGQHYIIKDYWRADGRAYESAFLKKLAGVKGVGQMFAFDDDRETIKAGRGFDVAEEMFSHSTNLRVLDRSLMRIVLPKYGDTLEKAPSARELLCAVRDIVAGHREASMEKEILHRDISFSNIRLSPYDPERGVVIDWDLAKEMTVLLAGEATDGDSRTGTRMYQSVKVLQGSPKLGHHDNMDDLESILYVLCHVLYGFDPHGNPLPDVGFLADWGDTTSRPTVLSQVKTVFLQNPGWQMPTRFLGAEMEIMLELLKELCLFFQSRVKDVLATARPYQPESFPAYSKEAADDQYKTFLGILNPVIEQLPLISSVPLSAEQAVIAFPALLPGSTPQSPTGSASSSKRRWIADDEDSRPQLKRSCNEKKASNSAADDSDSDGRSPSPSDRQRGKKALKDSASYRPNSTCKRSTGKRSTGKRSTDKRSSRM
ncbi:hypothetical protein B0H15DRAFT_867661 [Mycena belliarum]|uniref:Protein kinase domain-containing protein n=1 Tax=Mycena belliarum TaxID=1033014 RepID=A0AAD6TTX6_9AGAR|nr:hypothetical protein B0H15DRAFT_867661 [Mycena belliae]